MSYLMILNGLYNVFTHNILYTYACFMHAKMTFNIKKHNL